MCLFAVALALASAAPTVDRHRHHSTEPVIWLESPSTTSRLSKLDAATLIEIDDAKDLDALKSKFREFIMEGSTSDECPAKLCKQATDGAGCKYVSPPICYTNPKGGSAMTLCSNYVCQASEPAIKPAMCL